MRFIWPLFLVFCMPMLALQTVKPGLWRVVVQSPGGPLPFHLNLVEDAGHLTATIKNGSEALTLDTFEVAANGQLHFGFSHYESYFDGQLDPSGTAITGTWSKVSGPGEMARLPFQASFGETKRFERDPKVKPVDLDGTWSVVFDGQGDPSEAVGIFRQKGDHLEGTFLTPTGDHRYLEGVVQGSEMFLSCFDGGHMFLYRARLDESGNLQGDFWSRDTWHETWSAHRDPKAALPDAYGLSHLKPGHRELHFNFPIIGEKDGAEPMFLSNDDSSLKGKVQLITIFGSWCPNCNDEAPFLQTLYERYRDQGLVVVGLAFEMTGDAQRDRRVVRRFKSRHKLTYPILLAGGSTDKKLTAEALPDLEMVLSYPTTLLVGRSGEVISIHTGFSGPGTGPHYELQAKQYAERVEAALNPTAREVVDSRHMSTTFPAHQPIPVRALLLPSSGRPELGHFFVSGK